MAESIDAADAEESLLGVGLVTGANHGNDHYSVGREALKGVYNIAVQSVGKVHSMENENIARLKHSKS
jgi:hypothetical protein